MKLVFRLDQDRDWESNHQLYYSPTSMFSWFIGREESPRIWLNQFFDERKRGVVHKHGAIGS